MSLDSFGWTYVEGLELSFYIPLGFTFILSEGGNTHTIKSDGSECQPLDLASLGWALSPETTIQVERDWMVLFYESSTDCSGEPISVHFYEDGMFD